MKKKWFEYVNFWIDSYCIILAKMDNLELFANLRINNFVLQN